MVLRNHRVRSIDHILFGLTILVVHKLRLCSPSALLQLTNEAFGDNPQESTSRDDKKITESDFYTKA